MQANTDRLVDEILVLDCQSGSQEAIDLLVARWHSRLLRHSYYLTGDSDGAWEVAQEGWLGIVRGLSKLDDPSRFAAWAFRIVTNKARDWIRRRSAAPRQSADSLDVQTTDDAANRCDRRLDIHEILAVISHDSRIVLNLYYLEGLDVSEVAKALAIPNGTVKSRLHAARKEFKRIWDSKHRLRETSDESRLT